MNGDAIVDSAQVILVVKEGGIAIGGAAAGAQFQWKQDVTVSLTPGAEIATYLVQLKVDRGELHRQDNWSGAYAARSIR